MLRIALATGLFIAAIGLDARPAAAYEVEGPWCATTMIGHGGVQRDCHYRTFEECWPNVISGNRGFCGQNPWWAGWNGEPEARRPHHRRHAVRH